ncbi:MAG: LLM class flavin-dependent oxidoreductase [Actinomycetia bacterium]|nr:LLM class flavin-dependent oxidoreductase [Actinomycetes bacterium]
MHPFRFAVQVSELDFDTWRERVRWYEELGFSVISTPDHYLMQQWDPVALQAAVAAETTLAGVGSTVLNVGLRQPIDLARMSATVAAIAAGGCELGIGAGWMSDDYDIAGTPFDDPRTRLARLNESVEVIKRLWSQESTTFSGKYVSVQDAPAVLPLPLPARPKLLLGGTMRHALGIAGRHADIVSVFPSVASGKIGWPGWAAGSTVERTAKQTEWAREGARQAGRDPQDLEFSTQVTFTGVAPDPAPVQEQVALATGVSPSAQDDSTIFLTGTPAQARERLQRRREVTGLSYFVVFDLANNYANPDGAGLPTLPGGSGPAGYDEYMEAFSEAVIQPLTGQ